MPTFSEAEHQERERLATALDTLIAIATAELRREEEHMSAQEREREAAVLRARVPGPHDDWLRKAS